MSTQWLLGPSLAMAFVIGLHLVMSYLMPRLTRPDVYFAVTVPPEFRDSAEGCSILKRYRMEVTIFGTGLIECCQARKGVIVHLTKNVEFDCEDESSYPPEFEEAAEDLTIGVAFRCSDGIVLAGDRFRKKGDSGTLITKVRRFTRRRGLTGAMVGAGPSGFIDAAFDKINEALEDNMTLKDAKGAIDDIRLRGSIYKEDINHISEKPYFEFLVALWSRSDSFELFSGTSTAPLSVVRGNYEAIGTGAPLANCLVKTFYSLKGSCEQAALISVMTIRLVNKFIEWCNGGPNIVAIMKGGLVKRPRSISARKSFEKFFIRIFDSLKQIFSNLTLREGPDKFYRSKFQLLRADLQKCVEDQRRHPLLIVVSKVKRK